MQKLSKHETTYDESDPNDPDTALAAAFFDVFAPRLVASAASPLACERRGALWALSLAALQVPHSQAGGCPTLLTPQRTLPTPLTHSMLNFSIVIINHQL
jgi:hypothetical protein